MAYTINRFDGKTSLALVQDGTINSSLDISLIGKDYPGYGSIQNENFVYLLENFANSTPPPNAIYGQLWFDNSVNKLKYFDTNNNWKTTGGTEVGLTEPFGMSDGGLWFDKTNKQLKLWDADNASYILIGPQLNSNNLTQMVSTSIIDNSSTSHNVILAYVNGVVVYIINSDASFIVGNNNIIGFDTNSFPKIYQGLTLAYTNTTTQSAEATSNFKYYGSASNADRLGGFPASNYLNQNNPTFQNQVNFSDAGFTIGNPIAKLKIYNDSTNGYHPTIINEYSNTLVFQTTSTTGIINTPLKLVDNTIFPNLDNSTELGTSTNKFSDVYATTFHGNATSATTAMNMSISGTTYAASTSVVNTTMVARDGSGDIYCNVMHGVATSARYADLAEKYLTDKEYSAGTVMMVGGDKEITSSDGIRKVIGVISTNPAYMMNSELVNGSYVALKGRVPVRIYGKVRKGDELIPYNNGFAKSIKDESPHLIFAIALEDGDGLVECVIL